MKTSKIVSSDKLEVELPGLKVMRKLLSSAVVRKGNDEENSSNWPTTWQIVVACKMDLDSSHP